MKEKVNVTTDTWMLLAMTLVGAGCIVFHLALVFRVLKAPIPALHLRALALIPPLTPVVAWAARRRAETIVWGILVGSYVALRYAG